MSRISSRFYKEELPELDDVVTVMVRSISNLGAYVRLLEYNNREGMILMTELSRRRIRSVNKLIRVGKTETVVVIRLDDDRDYVDLSKRRISLEDVKKGEDKYIRAKTVYHILLHCCQPMGIKTNEEFDHLMRETAWRFHDEYKDRGGAYEAFERILKNPKILDHCNITDQQKKILINAIRHRLEPKSVKIRSDVEVSCYSDEGIEAVKAALKAGITYASTTPYPVKVSLISPPVYMVSSVILDRKEGLEALTETVNVIKEAITSRGGKFCLKLPPKILNEIDQEKLNKQLEDLERANEQMDGDDDTTEEDDESDDEKFENINEFKTDFFSNVTQINKHAQTLSKTRPKRESTDEDED